MLNLPQPVLGDITAFTITAPDLEASLAFYQKLGFKELFRADWPFPWIQVTDGVVLIMLRQDKAPYIALTYYVKDMDKVVADLDAKGIKFTQKPKAGDMVKRYVFQSPDGLNISLVSMVEGFSQPPGPAMLQMPQQDYFNPDKYVNKTVGMFGEFEHPVKDLDASMAFWEQLGFKAVSRFTSPYPWAIATDGLAIVGLHQTQSFDHPAITYFASDMKDKIDKLKANGLKVTERGGAASVVATSPEGQKIFLFKMGM